MSEAKQPEETASDPSVRVEGDVMRSCPYCHGTGERDSGGVYPWGEGIFVPCECEYAAANDKATKAEQRRYDEWRDEMRRDATLLDGDA